MAHVQAENEVMSADDRLQAQLELYHHSLAFVKSMALRAAADLRIPEAIHRRGGTATLSDIASDTGIHATKLAHLRRLMRVLTITGIFSSSSDAVFKLTPVSRLLAEGGQSSCNLSPVVVGVFVNPVAVTALLSIPKWFTDERAAALSLFEVAHGCTRWEMAAKEKGDSSLLDAGMVADSTIIMEVLLRDSHSIFEGVSSLVDVGGGHGAVAAAVARAFPEVNCTVLDLPHVVAGAPANESIQFVAGDMFEHIPSADVVLLKWILHCWQDEHCINILRRCKEAIPSRDAGGKVIIIDMVVGYAGAASAENVSMETQVLSDVYKMYMDGVEREEDEWAKIFSEAGFSDYKISPVLGFRSIIEVYP
ncbi:acetylserotonin O-methyltransferase 1-like [Triticum dicoccoides]|uniref:acetylserotonin O-methyltransferase 1-like n=1 Tax=Triticum dicoccoides TaxID=85692 RepID=UPI001890FD0E|nr:acetylserotonin O-methyltransferase 1-like [Triticum dicoccoides]